MNTVEREQQWAQKATLRRTVLRRRDVQPNKAVVSERICATLERLPEYRQARAICSYVGVGSEVLTWNLLRAAIAEGKQVIVPYVDGSRLRLFHLRDLVELVSAPFGLLATRKEQALGMA
jgi:5-formyltetrahydrofolate cyclo-ligase